MRLLIFRDLQTWPGAQKTLINQQRHQGEPVGMALWLGRPWFSLLKDILLPLVFQKWLPSWRQAGLLARGWGKTET